MDFDFSSEQQILRQQAKRFLAEHCGIAAVRRVLERPDCHHDAALWRALAAQGYLGAAIPAELGGLGLGPLETCVIAEEIGRVIAPVPLVSTIYLAAPTLIACGSAEQRRRYLAPIAAGRAIGCYAISEPDSPGDRAPACQYREGRIHGTKTPVTDGMIADFAIVTVAHAQSLQLALVDLRGNVERTPLATIDPTRGAARLRFDGAEAQLLETDAPRALDAAFCRAAVYLAFEQIGGADRCLEMARDYALQRHAFGAPIGRYQAIKHQLADLYVAIELARSNAYYAAWALETSDRALPAAAAAARVAASEAFWRAARENIHVHGGSGFTWEMDCHLYYRRAHQLSLIAGSPNRWRQRLLSELSASRGAARSKRTRRPDELLAPEAGAHGSSKLTLPSA